MSSEQGTAKTLVDLLCRRAGEQPDREGYSFLLDGEGAEANTEANMT